MTVQGTTDHGTLYRVQQIMVTLQGATDHGDIVQGVTDHGDSVQDVTDHDDYTGCYRSW